MQKPGTLADDDQWLRKHLCTISEIATDEALVRAALEAKWSNGQTEGQVNRLKLLKRQMYGRANLDLLRRRVLYQA